MEVEPVVVVFGTYDQASHPRVAVIVEGLKAHGCRVVEVNRPIDFDTAARVELAARPWRLPGFLWRLLRAWVGLLFDARRLRRHEAEAPSLVVVGYLGHFDVHLARRLYRCPIVLDYLIGLGDTAADRRLDRRRWLAATLHWLDRRAAGAADVVLVDTDEQAAMTPAGTRVVVLPVGAPSGWFAPPVEAPADQPVRVVFFGLYTPLQGAPTIGAAIAALAGRSDIEFTMIGDGQDRAATVAATMASPAVDWVDWVDAHALPALVQDHHVCLGIFGSTAKAGRVVPNKVYQGAAAGCAVVTSDTAPQRAAFGAAAVLVPAADPGSLAAAIADLADDRSRLQTLRTSAHRCAVEHFSPAAAVAPLLGEIFVKEPNP